MLQKTIARWVVLMLLWTMLQPMLHQDSAYAEELVESLPAVADKFVDAVSAYPNGELDTDLINRIMFVGYYRDPGMDLGASNAALRFDLQNTRPGIVQKAELQIYVNRVDRLGGDPFIDLWGSNDDGWSDSADRSMPAEDVSIVSHETNLTASTWLTFDVTSFIRAQKLRADNRLASFLLKGHQTPPSGAEEIAAQIGFYGMPTGSGQPSSQYAPQLKITYAPNSPPTQLTLSGNSLVQENQPPNTPIGTLSATDPDSNEAFTYSLDSGDVQAFAIVGNELRTAQSFDYETKKSYSVNIRVVDSAGNQLVKGFTIGVADENEAPTGATLSINGGAAYAKSPDVTLSSTIADPDEGPSLSMQFSNVSDTWSDTWSDYTGTPAMTPWRLDTASGDGVKTVYMQGKDEAGHVITAEDSIVLDTTPPVGSLEILGVDPANTTTDTTQVSLNLTAQDANGPVEVKFSNSAGDDSGSWQVIQSPMTWNLTGGEGEKTVYVQLRDAAGNVAEISDAIVLDSTSPVVSGVANNGKYNTSVTPIFNEGTATLNGADFISGTTVEAEDTYELIVKDAANHTTTVNFTIDKTAPTGELRINDGAGFTNNRTVTLNLTASDATSITVVYANEDGVWSPPETYTTPASKSWTLSPGAGTKTVHVKLTDEMNNETELTAQIELDDQPPTGDFTVNNGQPYTKSRTVELNVAFDDNDDGVLMRVANDVSSPDDWSEWGPAKSSLSWELTAGDGVKTVYLELKDQAGNILSLSDEIILDTVGPVVSGVVDQSFYNADPTIVFTDATATLDGADFASGSTVSAEGEHTLIVTDDAGNETRIVFTLDKTPPSGTFSINQGAEYATSRDVTLDMVVNGDESGLQVSFAEPGGAWSSWEAYQPAKPYRLTEGEGEKTVQVQWRDKAGNTADRSDSITLDTIKPEGSLTIQNGESVVQSRHVTLALTASDSAGSVEVRLANEDGSYSDWGPLPDSLDWELTEGDGEKTVQMEIRDQAGNRATASDTIRLDQQAPDVEGVEDGGIYSGEVVITFAEGTATLNGDPYVSGTPVSADGTYSLIVTDDAQNQARLAFTIDQTPPVGSLAINSGAAVTGSVRVTLFVAADDLLTGVEMRISNENGSWSDWQSVSDRIPWELERGNGTKKVLVELRDGAGNTASLEDTIELRVYAPPPPPTDIPVTGVTLDDHSLTLRVGEKQTLTATVQPANADNKRVRWHSSDTDIAKVDADGEVEAIRPGEATITVTTEDGGKADSAKVAVRERVTFHLEASETSFWLKPKASKSFRLYKVDGKKRTDITKDKGVAYETDNGLVTIESGRIIAGRTEGEERVTASYQGEELTIPVTISKQTLRFLTITTGSEVVLGQEETRQLDVTAVFTDQKREVVTKEAAWSSSNPAVVEVTDEGEIIGVGEGTTVITARYGGKKATIPVLALEEKVPLRISASPSYVRLKAGESKEIALYGYYGKGYEDILTEEAKWSVDDPQIAAVEGNAVIGQKAGRTTITVSLRGKTAKITVIVR